MESPRFFYGSTVYLITFQSGVIEKFITSPNEMKRHHKTNHRLTSLQILIKKVNDVSSSCATRLCEQHSYLTSSSQTFNVMWMGEPHRTLI